MKLSFSILLLTPVGSGMIRCLKIFWWKLHTTRVCNYFKRLEGHYFILVKNASSPLAYRKWRSENRSQVSNWSYLRYIPCYLVYTFQFHLHCTPPPTFSSVSINQLSSRSRITSKKTRNIRTPSPRAASLIDRNDLPALLTVFRKRCAPDSSVIVYRWLENYGRQTLIHERGLNWPLLTANHS